MSSLLRNPTEFALRRLAAWASMAGLLSSLFACADGSPTTPERIPVAQVRIEPVDEALVVGTARALQASALSAAGAVLEDRPVTWESDNVAVATVNATGMVTAHAEGVAGIAASSEGKVSRIDVHVVAPNPAPVITALDPSIIPSGSVGPITVDVGGTGFVAATRLRIDGVEQSTDYIDATTLRLTLSTAQMANAAEWTVSASNPAPGGGVSNALELVIEDVPLPAITSLDPQQINAGWPGSFTLTVTGTGFTPRSSVTWDGAARGTRYVSTTSLQITVDPQDVRVARAVPVVVETPGGGSATATFAVNAIPVAQVTVSSPSGFAWTWRNHGVPLTAVAVDYLGRELADRHASWSVADPLIATTGIVSHRDARIYGLAPGETDVEAVVDGIPARRTVRVHETPAFDIVYEAGSGDDRHLMLWDLSTGNAPRRLPTTVAAFSPSPSPDGRQFAFVGVEKGLGTAANADLYIVRRDGLMHRVAPSDAFDGDPAWSPDGTRLAFTSARWSGSLDVFVVDLASRNVTRLTDANPFTAPPGSGIAARAPAWSPDGTQLAYSVQTGTGSQLWVMSANGANKRLLTNGAGADDFEPAWSPDGSVIAFAREFRQPKRTLVLTVRPDGTNVTNIDGRVVNVAATPSYSPDGRWLTTGEVRGNELGAVYAFSTVADAGPRIVLPVEIGGGRHARWVRRP